MSKKFDFGTKFQRIIVQKIVENDPTFVYWLDNLQPEYFEVPSLRYFVNAIQSIHKKQEIIPTFDILRDTIKRDDILLLKEKTKYLKKLQSMLDKEVKIQDEKYALDKLSDFIRVQRYYTSFESALGMLERGQIDNVDSLFKQNIELGTTGGNTRGMEYFKDYKERLFARIKRVDRYKFLIGPLDHRLRFGGMAKGETVFWLAAPAVGKSMSLVHTAKAWLIQRLKGVYYTLQLPEEDIAERFDSSFAGVNVFDLNERKNTVEKSLKRQGHILGNSLIIKYFPRRTATITDIRRHLHQLIDNGFKPDFVVIDFLNYLNVSRQTVVDSEGSRYFAGGDVAGEFIALCQEMNILGATGIQGNRSAVHSELVTMSDVAESFQTAMEATLVVSINRNADERTANQARLFMAKYTYGEDQIVIPITTNYAKGSFYKKD